MGNLNYYFRVNLNFVGPEGNNIVAQLIRRKFFFSPMILAPLPHPPSNAPFCPEAYFGI
jgi:hypothetical protein